MRYKGLVLAIIGITAVIVLLLGVKRQEKGLTKAIEGLNAPDISLNDLSGRELRLSELKDSVVFINFWASWCQPCREEMPSLQVLYNNFRDYEGFRMITILYRDDPYRAVAYLKENNLDLPLWIDRDGRAASAYGLTGVPETFIIDKRGILRKKVIGPADWASPQVVSFISELIKG